MTSPAPPTSTCASRRGLSEVETVVTVICGELDSVVSREADGGVVTVYEACVDGLG